MLNMIKLFSGIQFHKEKELKEGQKNMLVDGWKNQACHETKLS